MKNIFFEHTAVDQRRLIFRATKNANVFVHTPARENTFLRTQNIRIKYRRDNLSSKRENRKSGKHSATLKTSFYPEEKYVV